MQTEQNAINLIGAIITDRGNTILARGIRWFMKQWGKIRYRKTGIIYKPGYGNHARIVVQQNAVNPYEVIQMEAVKEGVVSKWNNLADDKNFKIFQLRRPLDQEEYERMLRAGNEVLGHKYQVGNFFTWMILIGTFGIVNLFPREPGNTKKFFCFELVAYLSNMARPGLFPDYEEHTDIYDIESNPNYKEITL